MSSSDSTYLYYDGYSIMVVNSFGRIRRLYTPFRVQCIDPVDEIVFNSSLFVDEIFEDADNLLLFKINGNLYPFYHFSIEIRF